MFIGRLKELSKIEDFVFKSNRRFLNIFGKRGIGKTALIYQFLQKNKVHLNDKVVTINAFDISSLPTHLNAGKELLIIDNYLEFLGDNALSVTVPERTLRNFIAHTSAKKIILISPDPPDFFNEELIRQFDYLEVPPFSNQDLDALFQAAFNSNNNLNLRDFYDYFENNPRSILTALHYYSSSDFKNERDFFQFIDKPLKQYGLIDLQGNPLNSNSDESKIITQSIIFVNNSLVKMVNSNPGLIYQMTPRQFEELVAELLEKEGFIVNLTKQTRDGGKDIFIAQKNNLGNFLYYIECKQYAADNPVGVNLVRELYGTISADRATAGLLVTSSYFTKDAINFTQNIQHQLSLKGYIDLKKWITEMCKK